VRAQFVELDYDPLTHKLPSVKTKSVSDLYSHDGSGPIALRRMLVPHNPVQPAPPSPPWNRNTAITLILQGSWTLDLHTIRHCGRNASGGATQPGSCSGKKRRQVGGHLRRRSDLGLARHPKPGHILNMACVNKTSAARVTGPYPRLVTSCLDRTAPFLDDFLAHFGGDFRWWLAD
jgi:hypothetical protein